jgi:hypothetical protein
MAALVTVAILTASAFAQNNELTGIIRKNVLSAIRALRARISLTTTFTSARA